MKTLFWIVLVAFVLLAGFVVRDLVLNPRTQARPAAISFEVGAESAAAYERRVADLEAVVVRLKERMTAIGSVGRQDVKARLAEFEAQIRELKLAIAQWRIARGGDAPDAAYRQCILAYGKAAGICRALATDTLPGK
jgi:hypothetical protein